MTRLLFLSLVTAALTLGAAPAASAQLRATLVASGFDRPLGLVAHPGTPGVLLILEQAGRVRILQNGAPAGDFLDLRSEIGSGGEQGLLGLAFAPDYASSGRLFVCYTNRVGDTVVARFRRAGTTSVTADPASRFEFRWPDGRRVIRQPFTNHNGGHLAFGPDGYLYVGLGDGGSGNDPMHLAQHPRMLLGKMLRLDVSVPDADEVGYRVPPTNPFVGRADVLPEIWAFGLRNPWRWSFDDPARGGTGAMVIGDVGQNRREEIDYAPPGAGGRNYGWRNFEGFEPNVTDEPPFPGPLTDPIWDYDRNAGRSITGGYVYRGSGLGSAHRGRYFFGDFVTSRVWSLALSVDAATGEARASNLVDHSAELGPAAASPASFGIDASGELYVVGYSGTIHRIEGPGDPPGPAPPATPAPTEPNRPYTGAPVGSARPRQ